MKVLGRRWPQAVLLTSCLGSCLGTETLETVKCGTGGWTTPVSTQEKISVVL